VAPPSLHMRPSLDLSADMGGVDGLAALALVSERSEEGCADADSTPCKPDAEMHAAC